MSKQLLDQIVGQLGQLTGAERHRLYLVLANVWRTGKIEPSPSEDWILDGIRAELIRRGVGAIPCTTRFVNGLAPNYWKDSEAVRVDLQKRLKKSGTILQQAHLLALGKVAARALADHLKAFEPKQPMGSQTLLRNVHRIPEAIEASYPGYLAAGMIGCLVGLRKG